MKRLTEFTLITGASAGIGKALAEEFASRNNNIALVALSDESLPETAQEIREKYKVKVVYFGIDLSDANAAEKIYQWCQEEKIDVNILVNNAGLGTSGAFENYSPEFYQKIIQLNSTSMTMLTRFFLPHLLKKEKAYILNVSSMAGLVDVPFKVIYSATKRFVYSFSRALGEELRESNVSVTVLCPLGVATNPDVQKRATEIGKAAQITYLSAEYVAQKTVKKMLKGKPVVKPGFVTILYDWIIYLVPYHYQLKILYHFFQRSKEEGKQGGKVVNLKKDKIQEKC